MAARLLKSLKSFHKKSNKFDSFLESSWVVQKKWSIHSHPMNTYRQSNKERINERCDNFNKYGVIFTAVTAVYLFLYSSRDKLKVFHNLLPTVHAIEKTDNSQNSLRKRFNFIADVVEKSADAVVYIRSQTMFRGTQNVIPAGSGFIVRDNGLILTNAHVVNSMQGLMEVKLKDGRVFRGQIEDIDLAADLATVRINAKNLPVMDLGSSSDLRAGEWVVAIGSPFSLTDSVSAGVVSVPRRKGGDIAYNFKDMQYIQTDAALNFGNSGGPLVNLDGEVVGVNCMKVTPGISFAIPIEYAKEFLHRSAQKKQYSTEADTALEVQKRYIGVTILSLNAELIQQLNSRNYLIPEHLVNGILICHVIIGSPAFHCGLLPGDVITEINGKPVNGTESFFNALQENTTLNLIIFRRGQFFMIPELSF